MVKYESLLYGGAKEMCSDKEMSGGKMTYEDRCKNLAKARAVRADNLKKGIKPVKKVKKVKGKGQYNQDYVDESQVNYMGSPLDMYYHIPAHQAKEIKGMEGENVKGGKMRKSKMMKEEPEDESEDEEMEDEEMEGGKMKKGKKKGKKMEKSSDMAFIKNSNHTGMTMPTKEEFKRGGDLRKATTEAINVNIPEAIQVLAQLATKFGLKLTK